jgi:hypothetical protein
MHREKTDAYGPPRKILCESISISGPLPQSFQPNFESTHRCSAFSVGWWFCSRIPNAERDRAVSATVGA